jgi:hypothetical protein
MNKLQMLSALTAASSRNDIAEISRLMGVIYRAKLATNREIVAAERAGVGEGQPDFSKA